VALLVARINEVMDNIDEELSDPELQVVGIRHPGVIRSFGIFGIVFLVLILVTIFYIVLRAVNKRDPHKLPKLL